jgi:hypothetical protein
MCFRSARANVTGGAAGLVAALLSLASLVSAAPHGVLDMDFWTARRMTPEERMHTVAGLDNPVQSRFEVGPEQCEWLRKDLATVSKSTPLVVFSHSPLYKYYKPWNFWTDDGDEVQSIASCHPWHRLTARERGAGWGGLRIRRPPQRSRPPKKCSCATTRRKWPLPLIPRARLKTDKGSLRR